MAVAFQVSRSRLRHPSLGSSQSGSCLPPGSSGVVDGLYSLGPGVARNGETRGGARFHWQIRVNERSILNPSGPRPKYLKRWPQSL